MPGNEKSAAMPGNEKSGVNPGDSEGDSEGKARAEIGAGEDTKSAAMPSNECRAGEESDDELAVVVVDVFVVAADGTVATRATLAGKNATAEEFSFLLTPADCDSASTEGVQGSVRGDDGI